MINNPKVLLLRSWAREGVASAKSCRAKDGVRVSERLRLFDEGETIGVFARRHSKGLLIAGADDGLTDELHGIHAGRRDGDAIIGNREAGISGGR